MTMFMMTAEQYAQIVDALESCSMDCDAVGADGGMSFDEDRVSTALAMLKAMQPASPNRMYRKAFCADWYEGYPDDNDGSGPYERKTCYTPTKD